jgi:sugar lactone lactonase YvrE
MMGRLLAVGMLAAVVLALDASAASPVRVSLVQSTAPVAGRAWTAKLKVRPTSFRGTVRVTASGARRMTVRATRRRGAYTARFVFPSAGRWTLAATAGGRTSKLGAVQVRAPAPTPLAFTWPTSVDVEPSGTLLVVENGRERVLRVDPENGTTTAVAQSIPKAFAAVRAPSGAIYVSGAHTLRRLDGSAAPTVAEATEDIGPIAIAANGDVYYATATRIFRLDGGNAPPALVAGNGTLGGSGDGGPALRAQFSSPHGLRVAGTSLYVADSGNNRIRRIELTTGVITAFANVATPHGIEVAADGTLYVCDGQNKRVVHLAATGAQLGVVGGSAFADPYDVEAAADGSLYVVDTAESGRIRRIAPDGSVTTLARR